MNVIVVGGGLAGLFIASELIERGIEDVVVLEKESVAGGVAQTIERDGFSLEPATGTLTLPHPHLSPILERAGVKTVPAVAASLRHVYVDGRLISIPPSPKALLAPVLGVRSKLRAIMEPVMPARPVEAESLADFSRRRFGKKAGDLVSWLMASGVFAGDPEHLSVQAAFPALAELERVHGSVIKGVLRRRRSAIGERPSVHVPVDGMTGLGETLAGSLGGRFHPGIEVRSLRRDDRGWIVAGPEELRADMVVLAVSPYVAADLVEDKLGGVLREADAAPVAVVFLGGSGPSPLPQGFGVLVGPEEGLLTRGVLFESSYAPSRAPEGSWLTKVIVASGDDMTPVDWTEDRLISVATSELATILTSSLSTDLTEVVRHLPGIPQYPMDHNEWLSRIDGLRAEGMYVAGWGYRGVGVGSLASDAIRVAEAITS